MKQKHKQYEAVDSEAVKAWVDAHFKVVTKSGSEWDVLCPVHGDSNASMRINVDKGVGFCHGCHFKGGMKALAQAVGTRWSGDTAENRMSTLLAKLDLLKRGPERSPITYWDEGRLDRYRLPTPYWTETRGFTQETIDAFDLGFDPIAETAIIPIRDVHNRLLGVTRRFLGNDADCRYRDPKGFKKANNLFGSWFVAQQEEAYVVLTEGPLDAVKVWQAGHPAVAQFGSHLSLNQIRILRAMGLIKVVLFYDNDRPGKKAFKEAMGYTWDQSRGLWGDYQPEKDLRSYFLVERVKYGKIAAKDPGAMSDLDIRRSIRHAHRVL